MILATCPNCRSQLQAPESLANKRVKCPKCQFQFAVPSPFTAPSPKVAAATSTAVGTASSLPHLRMLVGFGLALALLLTFGVTIGLVVYFSVKPTGQVENKEVASGPRTERDGPPRLLDERRPNHETPTLLQPNQAVPAVVVSKPLAKMDRLTLEVASPEQDDAPTPEVWTGHTASIRGVAFTDDGRFVVSVSGALLSEHGQGETQMVTIFADMVG